MTLSSTNIFHDKLWFTKILHTNSTRYEPIEYHPCLIRTFPFTSFRCYEPYKIWTLPCTNTACELLPTNHMQYGLLHYELSHTNRLHVNFISYELLNTNLILHELLTL